jgi:hypothetical protein
MFDELITQATLPLPRPKSGMDMEHVAHELQENIAQTAACIKLLVQSMPSENAVQADKLALIERYVKVLMHDIRALSSSITYHVDY